MLYTATLRAPAAPSRVIVLGVLPDLPAAYVAARRAAPPGFDVVSLDAYRQGEPNGCGADLPLLRESNAAGC